MEKSIGEAGHELTVVLDFRGCAVFLPIFLDGAHTVRADGNDLLDLVLGEVFEVFFGELLEEQVVAESAHWIASAFLFAEDAEACAEVAHDAGEVGDDLAALWIVAAHAAEPEAVFLGSVEDGQGLLLDEAIALSGAEAKSIRAALQIEEELAAVVVFPCAGVDGAPAEADEDGQVLDADGALELAGPTGGALEDGFLRVVLAQQRFGGLGAKLVEIAAQTEDDFFGVEDLARGGGGAMLGATSALDARLRLKRNEPSKVGAGNQAEVFIARERRDVGEAAAGQEDGGGA